MCLGLLNKQTNKKSNPAIINVKYYVTIFFSFLLQMRTLQPISGIPKIVEWLAHRKDKLCGELNLALILWNVSTYLPSVRQACHCVKGNHPDSAWYTLCQTLIKQINWLYISKQQHIFQCVCQTLQKIQWPKKKKVIEFTKNKKEKVELRTAFVF